MAVIRLVEAKRPRAAGGGRPPRPGGGAGARPSMAPAAVFRRAITAGDTAAARAAAAGVDDPAERLALAEFAVRQGAAFEALILLRRRPAGGEGLAAWALFCEGRRRGAARQWSRSEHAAEKRLGELMLEPAPAGAPVGAMEKLAELAESGHPPVVAAASHLLAELLLSANQPAKALTRSRKAEWHLPGWIAAKRLTARAAEAAQQPRLAFERWRDIVRRLPSDAEAHEHLGRLELAEGRRPRARIHFRQSLEGDPFNIALRLRLGDLAMEEGDAAEAVEHWETAHRLDPRAGDPLRRLIDVAWEDGALEAALNWCRKLLALGVAAAEEEEHLEMVGYLYSELLLSGAGFPAREVGEFFADARRRYPSNPYLEVYDARRLVADEKFAEAEPLLRAVVRRNPMMPEAVFELGHLCLMDEARHEEGRGLLLRAARIDSDPFYAKELGRHLLDAAQWREAETWLKKALSTGLEDEETMLNLYLALFHQRKFSAAENVLRQIMVRQPGHMQAMLFLSEVLLVKGKIAEAETLVGKVLAGYRSADDAEAVEKAPESIIDPPGAVHWIAGYAALLAGRFEPAEKHFRRARFEAADLEGWFEELNLAVAARLAKEPTFAAEAGRWMQQLLSALKLQKSDDKR